MAFFNFGFFALLELLAGSHSAASSTIPDRPPFPFASLNGSLVASASSRASGSFAVGGALCTDTFGAFPCSCLALSFQQQVVVSTETNAIQYATEIEYHEGTGNDESITGTTVVTMGGKEVYTETGALISNPPDDCCESCEIDSSRVHILFWPLDDNQTTAQNASNVKATTPYTMVSNGFTL